MPLDLDEIIKALAHPMRRDILDWLKDPQQHFADQHHSLENGVCAGQIDQRCGLSQWHFFRRNEETISAFLQQLSLELK
jgi:DNA-binding transcriptional ArsR family regulator